MLLPGPRSVNYEDDVNRLFICHYYAVWASPPSFLSNDQMIFKVWFIEISGRIWDMHPVCMKMIQWLIIIQGDQVTKEEVLVSLFPNKLLWIVSEEGLHGADLWHHIKLCNKLDSFLLLCWIPQDWYQRLNSAIFNLVNIYVYFLCFIIYSEMWQRTEAI